MKKCSSDNKYKESEAMIESLRPQPILQKILWLLFLCFSILHFSACQSSTEPSPEQELKPQYQTYMLQQPLAPRVHREIIETQAASITDTVETEDNTNIQFVYPNLDPLPEKNLITHLYSAFAIRNLNELDNFFKQHHVQHSKYFSDDLQRQLKKTNFTKYVLVVISKPDLSKMVLQDAQADQTDASDFEPTLLYSRLSLEPSKDQNLNLNVLFSYSGDIQALDQSIQPNTLWDTDFYLIPIKNKSDLTLSFNQKNRIDQYPLKVAS